MNRNHLNNVNMQCLLVDQNSDHPRHNYKCFNVLSQTKIILYFNPLDEPLILHSAGGRGPL